ncbi:unnamed protein product [Gordionus sp. m RMFG-2023]
MKKIFFYIFVIKLLNIVHPREIDFSDITSYDHSIKQNRFDTPENHSLLTSQLQNKLLQCEEKHKNAYPKNYINEEETKCVLYLKRYVSIILSLFETACSDPNQNNLFKCNTLIKVKAKDIKILQNYIALSSQNSHNKGDHFINVMEVLFGLITPIQKPLFPTHYDLRNKFLEIFGIGIETIIFILLCFILIIQATSIMKRSLWRFFFALTFASFLLSFPWTWLHLYKKAVVKRQLEILMPPECENVEFESAQSFASILKSYLMSWAFFPTKKMGNTQERCRVHHETLLLDPFWEITPSYAMAVTITKFVLEPLHHVGSSFNSLIFASFSGLPTHYVLTLLGIVSLFSLSFLLMSFGYKLRLPFFFATLEPSGPHNRIFSGVSNKLSIDYDKGSRNLYLEDYETKKSSDSNSKKEGGWKREHDPEVTPKEKKSFVKEGVTLDPLSRHNLTNRRINSVEMKLSMLQTYMQTQDKRNLILSKQNQVANSLSKLTSKAKEKETPLARKISKNRFLSSKLHCRTNINLKNGAKNEWHDDENFIEILESEMGGGDHRNDKSGNINTSLTRKTNRICKSFPDITCDID